MAGRHRKTSTLAVRSTAVAFAALGGVALLTGPASAHTNPHCDTECPPEVPVTQVGDLVAAQVNLLHCDGQLADIKVAALRQHFPVSDPDWAVKTRVLVGRYCHHHHTPPVVVVPVEPAPAPVPAPVPVPVVASPDAPMPVVTH